MHPLCLKIRKTYSYPIFSLTSKFSSTVFYVKLNNCAAYNSWLRGKEVLYLLSSATSCLHWPQFKTGTYLICLPHTQQLYLLVSLSEKHFIGKYLNLP